MSTFADFVRSCGLLPKTIICDSDIHRCGTQKHPRSSNGAYSFNGDRGWCQDWSETGPVNWWKDENAKSWTEEEKKKWNDRRIALEKERRRTNLDAAQKAQEILSKCYLSEHAYLRSKQLPSELGLIDDNGHLFVPMRDLETNKLTGLQEIFWNEEKEKFIKKFIYGTRAKGSVFVVGAGKKTILVEGYATGLSVYMAARQMNISARVMCCFSATNMVHVAKTHGHFVMADNDASKTGEKAAIDTGLPWEMPEFVGMDWNDVHAEEGIFSVCKALLDLNRKVA